MKKLCCMLLAVAFIVCMTVTSTYAMTGIDLSRIKFSSGEKPIYFKFGNLSSEGVVRQQYPFTKEEIEKVAMKTLKSMGMTQLDLVELGRKVQKAQRAASFTQEDIDRVKKNILTSINVVPPAGDAATVLSVIDQYMSSNSWNDIGTVSSDLLSDSMSDKVKETAKGYIAENLGEVGADFVKTAEWKNILMNISEFCQMLADEYANDKQKWTDIAEGANAKRQLNTFYDKLQEEIDAYKYKSNKEGWTIDFDHAMTYRTFSFFGTEGNIQQWYLDMNLRQTSTNEYGSIAGTYEGKFTMSAEHDMSAFTSGIDKALPKFKPIKNFLNTMSGTIIKPSFKKASDGNAYISRTIGGSCSAEIDKSGKTQLTLNQNSDESNVLFSGISADIVLNTGTQLDKYAKLSMRTDIGNKKENILVTFKSSDVDFTIPGSMSDQSYSAGGWGYAGWDDNIWKPWNGTQKKLSLDP